MSNVAAAAKQLRVGMVMTPDHPHVIAMNKFGDLVKAKNQRSVEIKVFSELAARQTPSPRFNRSRWARWKPSWTAPAGTGQLVGDYYYICHAYLMKDIDHTARGRQSHSPD